MVRIQKESEVLLVAKTSLLRQEQKEHLKGEVGQAERHWCQNEEVQGFSREGVYILI